MCGFNSMSRYFIQVISAQAMSILSPRKIKMQFESRKTFSDWFEHLFLRRVQRIGKDAFYSILMEIWRLNAIPDRRQDGKKTMMLGYLNATFFPTIYKESWNQAVVCAWSGTNLHCENPLGKETFLRGEYYAGSFWQLPKELLSGDENLLRIWEFQRLLVTKHLLKFDGFPHKHPQIMEHTPLQRRFSWKGKYPFSSQYYGSVYFVSFMEGFLLDLQYVYKGGILQTKLGYCLPWFNWMSL